MTPDAILKFLLPILRLLTPTLKKRAATYAADYLNQRRQKQLGEETSVSAEPEQPPPEVTVEPGVIVETIPAPRAIWSMLSSAILGAAIGFMVGVVLVKKN
jgi:hypothetical protein